MLRMFAGFNGERALRHIVDGVDIVHAQNYYPSELDEDYSAKNDAPWIRRFAEDGGRVVISGDVKMLQRPHEKLALLECNIAAVFFPKRWSEWPLCQKMSLLIHWWPTIVIQTKDAEAGFFRVPESWPRKKEKSLNRIPDGDLKMMKIERQKAMQSDVRKRRQKDRRELGTPDLFKGHK